MATLRTIVTNAYRESGIIQKGSSPDASQLEEGLDELEYIISNILGEEVGGDYRDIVFGKASNTNSYGKVKDRSFLVDNVYLFSNYRVLCHLDSAKDIHLDPDPRDGSLINVIDVAGNFSTNNLTIEGNGRKISGASSVVLNTDGDNRVWMYRADLAEWIEITSRTASDTSPFQPKYDLLLTLKLAMRLHPRYLVETRPETFRAYKEMLKKFRSQYTTSKEMRVEIGLTRLSSANRSQDYYIDDTTIRFNHGLVY